MTTAITVRSVDAIEQAGVRMYRYGLTRLLKYTHAEAVAATEKGTPPWLRIRMIAEMIGQVEANERALQDAQMSDTATGEDLIRLCDLRGITPSPGAGASGAVVVTNSGSSTYPADAELVAEKTGKRYRVVSTTVAATGTSVGVVGKDLGRATNLPAGSVLTWTSPPGGSAVTCVVGPEGLGNGQDADTEAKLRARLQEVERDRPGAGNWADVRQWTQDASASVEAAYVYPAVHGPSTTHTAYTVEGTAENRYQRAGSSALTAVVAAAVLAEHPEPTDILVTTVAHEPVMMAIKLSLPGPTAGGWYDAVPWTTSNTSPIRVIGVTSLTRVTVNSSSGPGLIGKRVAIWSVAANEFRHATVTSPSGAPGAFAIDFDRPIPGIAVGDVLCPDAPGIDAYGRALCEQVAKLSPGQRTFDTGRQVRRPLVTPEAPSQIDTALLARVQIQFPEVANATIVGINGVAYTAPRLPTAATGLYQPPNVFRIAQIGFYA